MINKLKILFLFSLIAVFSMSAKSPVVQPTVTYPDHPDVDRYLGKAPQICSPCMSGDGPNSIGGWGRELEKSIKKIKDFYSGFDNFEFNQKLLTQNYSVWTAKTGVTGNLSATAFYFTTQQKIMGYALVDPFLFNHYENDPVIQQIRALPLDTSDFATHIQLPVGSQMQVYVSHHEGYIERYILFESAEGFKIMALEAFYPEEHQQAMEALYIPALNTLLAVVCSERQSLFLLD